jgi:hypothetical protein
MGLLLGISGKRGVGKTLLGTILAEEHGFQLFSFAEALKTHCKQAFGLTSEQTDGILKEAPTNIPRLWVTGPQGSVPVSYWTPRDLMISVGQFYRGIDENFWVKRIMSDAKGSSLGAIHDVRFKNEAKTILDAGGFLVRLERDPELNVYKGTNTDSSETELDTWPFHFTIGADRNINRASLEVFAREILSDVQSKHAPSTSSSI